MAAETGSTARKIGVDESGASSELSSPGEKAKSVDTQSASSGKYINIALLHAILDCCLYVLEVGRRI
jgi:hypothetical protein